MRAMKYVFNNTTLKFVLIPDTGMTHADINGEWTHAGFISFDISDGKRIKVHCYGKSTSLDLEVGGIDAKFIESTLNRSSY